MKKLNTREVKALAQKIKSEVIDAINDKRSASNKKILDKFYKTKLGIAVKEVNKAGKWDIPEHIINEFAGSKALASKNYWRSDEEYENEIYIRQIDSSSIQDMIEEIKKVKLTE